MKEQESNENTQNFEKSEKSEKSENMYSYRSEADSKNNNNNLYRQSDAIRRAEENNNINVNINQNPTYKTQYLNPNINNKYSNKFSNNFSNKLSNKYSNPFSNNLENNNYNNNYNSKDIQNRMSQIFLNIQPDSFCYNWATLFIYIILEIIAIVLIGTLFHWDLRNHPDNSCLQISTECNNNNTDNININCIISEEINDEISTYYGLFRDINIMTFVGFGMFHTLIKKNTKISIVFNTLAVVISFQIGLFCNLFWENAMNESWKKGILNFQSFIKSLFNSCAVLVSLGGVLGKISHTQYLILFILEPILSSLNYKICETKLKTIDTGGALYVHTFGAIFGLAIYWVLFSSDKYKMRLRRYDISSLSDYFSKITSFIGVLFLINYFPSFNASLALSDDGRYRAIINTYFSICGSIIGSFILSGVFHKGKFIFNHILFSSFSGGIIISGCCAVCIDHWAAFLIGILSGFISIICFELIKPVIPETFFYDIYKILFVHGIPGFLGAFLTPMFIADLKRRLKNKIDYHFVLLNDMERDNDVQAGIQIGAIFLTILIASVGGIAVGFMMRISNCGKIENYFDDNEYFGPELNYNNERDDNLTNADDNRPSYNNESNNIK